MHGNRELPGDPQRFLVIYPICLQQPAPVLQEKGEAMEKIKSIFRYFLLFSYLRQWQALRFCSTYSTTALKDSLMRVARMQMVYTSAGSIKVRRIEIEAEGILHSEDLKACTWLLMEAYDA